MAMKTLTTIMGLILVYWTETVGDFGHFRWQQQQPQYDQIWLYYRRLKITQNRSRWGEIMDMTHTY